MTPEDVVMFPPQSVNGTTSGTSENFTPLLILLSPPCFSDVGKLFVLLKLAIGTDCLVIGLDPSEVSAVGGA